ncbi:MAG: biotin--[acetyl-CoA-carboxylase] ligase [Rhodospirillaceae bacterium]|nr:biotin--[acetyl-CoA-carboxylase] ligase [Rhodospirillaceae bacterium]
MTSREPSLMHPAVPRGWRLVPMGAVASTNDEARTLANGGAPEGTVVWAQQQLSGRGRRGRAWDSPEGNLYCSVVLRPEGDPARVGQLPFVVSLALARAIAILAPNLDIAVKWPNDVLIHDAKVSGLLLEGTFRPDGACDWVIVGLGANVASFPQGTEFPATSLAAAGARSVTVEALLEAYLFALASLLAAWHRDGFAGIRREWLILAWRRGAPLQVRLETETLDGTFEDLDEDGHLLLRLGDGGLRKIAAGDVFFARV